MHRLAHLALVGATIGTATSTILPWGTSGTRTRTSYELVGAAERAGLLTSGPARLAVVWYLVPALCGLVLLAASLRSVRMAAVAGGTLGVVVATGGVLVLRSPLMTEPSAVVGLGGGVATCVAATVTLITARRKT